jgi:serine phosphatase RsbU (regulator of sigma subunit)
MGETAAGVGGRLSYDELDPLVYTAIAERRSILVEGGVSPTFVSPGFREARARFLVIPLITEGGVLGTIEVNERDSDIATVTSDKQLIEGVAFQAVAAIENARLYERQRRSGQVRSLLSEIDSLLAESLERREVLREVTRLAVVGLQADGGALVLKEGSGWMARYASGEKRWVEREPLGADDLELAAAALRQRAPLLVLQRDEQPGHEHPAQRSGTLVAPLWLHDRVMGALFFTKANWLPVLDNETLDFAARLSSSVSMALGNQRMFEHEHRIAETLQQALLTVPPRLAGVEIAHRYQAATESARVGGDFYDVFEMKDKVVIAIGDVSGKGVDAAAVGSLAKNALRGHMLDLGSPSEALRKVNNLIHAFTEPAVFLTAFIGLLDLRTGVLRYASAGHPAPLVLRGAEVIAAEGADMLLGAFEDMVYAQREAHLAPGDMLFLYTDGLVEAPGGEDRYGETRLTDLLRDLRKDDGDQLLTEVFEAVTAFSDGGLEDDVALLAIRPTALRRPRGGRQKR